ncbi:hypothetical protein NBRC10513_007309 [Rhodotorula toruloides]
MTSVFNLSHPDWEESVGEPDDEAEEAVRTFISHDLVHFLPPNTPTYYPHTKYHPPKPFDLVLGSLRAEERVVSCGPAEDLESGSDHRPIRLVLALEITTFTRPPHRAFRRTDPSILERSFLEAVSSLPTSPLLTTADIDNRATQLTEALQIAVSAAVPFARTRVGQIVPWWDDELAVASRAAKKAANRAFRLRSRMGREGEVNFAERERRRCRNKLKSMLRRKRELWDERELAQVKEATLWMTVKKRISNSSTANASTPPLRRADGTYATSPLDKLALLRPLLLPTVTANSSNAPAPSQLPAASPQTRPPPARNPDMSTLHWTEPQLAKAANEMRVSGAQVSPGFIVQPATQKAEDCRASEPKRTSADPNRTTTMAKSAAAMRASTTKATTKMATTTTTTTMRTETQNDEAEGGGRGRRGEPVPVGEERQQVRSHLSYRNPREAACLSRYGVESRASEATVTPPEPDAGAPGATSTPTTMPWPELHECEVSSAIMQARPFAACGPDDVPNHILQLLLPRLVPHLVPLYRASLALGHLPHTWRDASCVVLRKPKKSDYRDPKAYRLIAFERCIAKALERIVAAHLAHLAESYELLSRLHFGGRRRRSAEDAVVCVVDEIKGQWRNGNAVVGLALDVSKAFLSVQTERLVTNLRARSLPRPAGDWICSFLSHRTCTLQLEGIVREPIEWTSGLPQGSPFSPILFLTYNSPLLDACATTSTCGFGWIDDVNMLAWGRTVDKAVSAMNRVIPRLEEWSDSHSSAFEPTKTEATIFLPPARELPDDPPPIILRGLQVKYTSTLTMLGAKLDSRLLFRDHIAACAARASASTTTITLLTRSKAGLAPKWARQLVVACVWPRMMWAAAAWYDPAKGKDKTRELVRVQKKASMAVTGGFRSAAGEALEIEAGLLPTHLQLQNHLLRLALRALAAPPSHPLHARTAAARNCPAHASYRSPLDLALANPLLPPNLVVETIHPDPVPPWSPNPAPSVDLARGKEIGTHEHEMVVRDLPIGSLLVYTDGSMGESGMVGAGVAAQLWDGKRVKLAEKEVMDVGLWQRERRKMGQHQTVYTGELEGLRLALASLLLTQTADSLLTTLISLDNTRAHPLHRPDPLIRPTSPARGPARL